ncbi:hypothetical protein Pcinc_010496 [Petrolisthes cinctipes]|uniref:Uncharacterized protein n=1 Tax=Petrolisthes cinctipes TaxID=88211 RepID=A0AAE1KTJ1_PETCI|nr:hypothetical protein Pcinc_010496 [Petrolisthes cinctipes]
MCENSLPRQLRPSPNEVEETLREEKQKWRIFRMQQVREQAREEAQRVLSGVRNQESHIKLNMKQDLNLKWQEKKRKEVQRLQREFEENTRTIGQAHKLAEQQPDVEKVLAERQQHNKQVAAQRGQEARKVEKDQMNQQKHEKERLLQQRQEAVNKEKLRAARVANLPTPQAFKMKKPVVKKVAKVQLHEAGTFTTTTYIPSNVNIEKEIWSTVPDARMAAEREAAVQVEKEKAKMKEAEEEERKRKERGQKALAKVRVIRLAQELVAGLDDAQRRHQLSAYFGDAPPTVFEVEVRDAKQQREMEKAVERILEEPHSPTPDEQPPLSPDLSHGLEEYDSSIMESDRQILSSQQKSHDLKSLLEHMKRRKNRLLKGLYNTLLDEQITDEEYDQEDSPQYTDDMIPQRSHDIDRPEAPHHTETVHDKEDSDMSSILPHTSTGNSNSELGSTDYTGPPSTLLPRTQGEKRERRSDDIHLAETVPVDLLPLHRITTKSSSNIHRVKDPPLMPQESESFEELTSEDININIELSAGSSGSTLKTVTTFDENISRPGSPVPQVSEISSTDYNSLPSSLPTHSATLQELEKNLQKIQEQRRRTQRLLDSKLDRRHQEASHQNSTPSTYTEKLKGEGSGQRPLKRKVKLEMQKKKLLQYYVKKLLDMKKDELENISTSTVEGSGLSMSSLSSLLETWQRYSSNESSVTVTTPSSSKGMITSSSDSNYTDIDRVPVKLSSISETSDESSSVYRYISNGNSRVPSTEVDNSPSTTSAESSSKVMSKGNSRVPSNLSTTSGESSIKKLPSKVTSEDVSRQLPWRKISSSSVGTSSSVAPRHMLPPYPVVLGSGSPSEYISAFSKASTKPVSHDVSPHLPLPSHNRGRFTSNETEQPSKGRVDSEQRHQQVISEEESESIEKKSSVTEPDPLQRLSTPPLPPGASDASLTKNVSFSTGRSNSYHTPSREYESSLDAVSDVSVPYRQGPLVQPSSLVRPSSEKSSDEQLNTLWSRRKYLHQHEKLSFPNRYKHKEHKLIKDTKEKTNTFVDNINRDRSPAEVSLPEVSTTHGNTMRNNVSTLPLSSYTGDHSRTRTFEAQHDSPISEQTQNQDYKEFDKSSEAVSQYRSIGGTTDPSKITPVYRENTHSYSFEQSQQQQQISHFNQSTASLQPQYQSHRSSTTAASQQHHHTTQISPTTTLTQQYHHHHHQGESIPSSSSCTSPPPPPPSSESNLKTAKEERESSESVSSMPDMGEILRRFGLDWADSMFRKMDRASSNSSSGSPV